MKLTRRGFIGTSVASAAAIPTIFGREAAEAALSADEIDWGMGFPEGSTLLNRNENPIGPSPKAIEAAKMGIDKSFRYADRILIKKLLSDHHGVDENHVLVGTGSGEILNLVSVAFMREPGVNMVATWESYRPIPGYAEKMGASVKWVNLRPENNYNYEVDRILDAVDENTRAVFMVTPNNPTGNVLEFDEMSRLLDGLPKNVILIVDGAYTDFHDADKDGIDLIKAGHKNVLVTRTFSKIHAMAGLRCGYGIAHPDIASEISKYGCSPTSTNMAGFAAMAASIGDEEHVKASRDFVSHARSYYEKEFDSMGINYLSGPPIFILAETGEKTVEIRDKLHEQKIFVRAGGEWGMPNHMRISYGLDHENETFIKALKEIMAG